MQLTFILSLLLSFNVMAQIGDEDSNDTGGVISGQST